MIWICKIERIALIDKDALLHPLTGIFPVKGCKYCSSDRIIPGELLLSRARFLFIQLDKCKEYSGLKKMCKLVAGLLTKKCKLFSGRVTFNLRQIQNIHIVV